MIRAKTNLSGLAFIALLCGQLGIPASAEGLARDMFYQQMKNPDVTATSHPKPHAPTASSAHPSRPSAPSRPPGGSTGNIGMSVYIELERGGKRRNVDVRTHFRNGDRVKFHVVSNTTGYIYVAMVAGSSGAKDMLFPTPKDPTNQVSPGKDYAIPAVTFLQFDNKPGREHLILGLTRQPIESSRMLSAQAPQQLPMAAISGNPAIDPSGGRNQVKVSLADDIPKPQPQSVSAPANDASIANAIPDDNPGDRGMDKDMFREDSGAHANGFPSSQGHSRPRPAHHAVAHTVHHSTYTPPAPTPTTVIVNTNANEDLYADISLEHD